MAAALSTGLAGSVTREAGILRAACGAMSASGSHLVLDGGSRVDALSAAFWNGALIHCSDYDDTHQSSVVHPSAPVLPAALVAAESIGASVGDLVMGYACGLESLISLAAATPGDYHRRGFHATAVCGPVGAAVAAAVVLGLPPPQVEQAARIASTYSGGSFQYILGGGNAKVTFPGHAARLGLSAVFFAQAGLSAPDGSVSGRFGLVQTHTGSEIDGWQMTLPEDLEAAPGPVFAGTAIKSYPCCYYSQVFLDAMGDLRGDTAWSGDIASIVEIVCEGPVEMIRPIFEPVEVSRRPVDSYDARFALPYQLAVMAIRGDVTMAAFSEASLADEDVLTLADRIRGVATADLGAYPHEMPGRVTVRFRDRPDMSVTRTASAGAERWGLDAPSLHRRISRDLGSEAAGRLISVLGDPDAPVSELTGLLGEVTSLLGFEEKMRVG